MPHRIDLLSAPLFVSWQLTLACNLACRHCCTESGPNRALADELERPAALALARQLGEGGVPYVMLCGGEPTLVPHFFEVAEVLGEAGVQLKIETNGQRFGPAEAERLARLPIRSLQISLDGATEATYAAQRPGGSLARALDACRAARAAGLPLEVTFAPTRLNIEQAGAVIELARELGAFRFNTGQLMRVGTAARQWERLNPDCDQYAQFRTLLERQSAALAGDMELCYLPFSLEDGLRDCLGEPPATLLVLPNGWVKVAAALPLICADLRRHSLAEAWEAYCAAWRDETVLTAVRRGVAEPAHHAEANACLSAARVDSTGISV